MSMVDPDKVCPEQAEAARRLCGDEGSHLVHLFPVCNSENMRMCYVHSFGSTYISFGLVCSLEKIYAIIFN
jgi:hypothetical protein